MTFVEYLRENKIKVTHRQMVVAIMLTGVSEYMEAFMHIASGKSFILKEFDKYVTSVDTKRYEDWKNDRIP